MKTAVREQRVLTRRLWCAALLGACLSYWSCYRVPAVPPGQRGPLPGTLTLPLPDQVVAASDTITEAAMQNVLFHLDDDIKLRIRRLRGQLADVTGHHLPIFDDKKSIVLVIAYGEIGLSAQDLTLLLNRYVFSYKGSPLRGLVVRTEGDHIVQTGIMHKVIDIPFEMTADVSVTPEGLIRIHTTSMKICGLDGKGLLRAVDKTLADLLDLKGARGVTVQGNDLLMDPVKILPPPAIQGRLTSIRVEQNELVQTFGSPVGVSELVPPIAVPNYIYFRGGNLRFGKLFMVGTDLLTIDGDPSDPFDFYLDYYHTQLVAGYHTTLPNYALVSYMPDFNDLGTAKGRIAPDNRSWTRLCSSRHGDSSTESWREEDECLRRKRSSGPVAASGRAKRRAHRPANSCARKSNTCAKANTARVRRSRRLRLACRRRAGREFVCRQRGAAAVPLRSALLVTSRRAGVAHARFRRSVRVLRAKR
jgi:hypothetical protein